MSLAELVERLRTSDSASRECSLLVVSDSEAAEDARALIGRGVNRVVTLDMSEEIIDQHVADLLDIAPRAAVRIAARLTTVLDNGIIEVVGRTANISATGMLLQTSTTLEIGQLVSFEFLTGDGSDWWQARARWSATPRRSAAAWMVSVSASSNWRAPGVNRSRPSCPRLERSPDRWCRCRSGPATVVPQPNTAITRLALFWRTSSAGPGPDFGGPGEFPGVLLNPRSGESVQRRFGSAPVWCGSASSSPDSARSLPTAASWSPVP